MGADPLANLEPNVLPEPIGWWPLAIGWWLLIIATLVIAVVCIRWWLRHRAINRYRKIAIVEMAQLQTLPELIALVRRTCAAANFSRQYQTLAPAALLDQLGLPKPDNIDAALYASSAVAEDEVQHLKAAIHTWIKQHQRPSC